MSMCFFLPAPIPALMSSILLTEGEDTGLSVRVCYKKKRMDVVSDGKC